MPKLPEGHRRGRCVHAVVAALLLALPGCFREAQPQSWAHFLSALSLPEVGQPQRFSPDRLRGRVVLVNFLATWCFPCLTDLPNLVELHRRHADQGFTVVAIGMDLEGERVLAPFASLYKLPFPLLLANERLRAGHTPFGQISVLPTTYLLAKDGRVLAAFQGVGDLHALDAAIEAALRE